MESLEYHLIVAVVRVLWQLHLAFNMFFLSTGAFLSKFAVYEGTDDIFLIAYSAN